MSLNAILQPPKEDCCKSENSKTSVLDGITESYAKQSEHLARIAQRLESFLIKLTGDVKAEKQGPIPEKKAPGLLSEIEVIRDQIWNLLKTIEETEDILEKII